MLISLSLSEEHLIFMGAHTFKAGFYQFLGFVTFSAMSEWLSSLSKLTSCVYSRVFSIRLRPSLFVT
jgi:hypothetical protein